MHCGYLSGTSLPSPKPCSARNGPRRPRTCTAAGAALFSDIPRRAIELCPVSPSSRARGLRHARGRCDREQELDALYRNGHSPCASTREDLNKADTCSATIRMEVASHPVCRATPIREPRRHCTTSCSCKDRGEIRWRAAESSFPKLRERGDRMRRCLMLMLPYERPPMSKRTRPGPPAWY